MIRNILDDKKIYRNNLFLKPARAALPLLAVAVPAIKGTISIRFERQFRDLGSALGAGPGALVHLAVASLVVVVVH